MSSVTSSYWTFADPDRESGWAYVVYDSAGLPHYGTARTQLEAAIAARRELERRATAEYSPSVLPDRPACAFCGDPYHPAICVAPGRESALRHGWREQPEGLMCTDCAWMRSGPQAVAA